MSNLFKRGQIWHAEFLVLGVRYRRSTGTRSKSDAQKIVDKWIADAQLTGRGVSRLDSSSTVQNLLTEYSTWLASKSNIHRTKTTNRLKRIIEAAGWTKPREITRLGCETAIRSLRNERDGKPLSAGSIAHYMTAAKMFVRWLVDLKHVLPVDPLKGIHQQPTIENESDDSCCKRNGNGFGSLPTLFCINARSRQDSAQVNSALSGYIMLKTVISYYRAISPRTGKTRSNG